MGSALGIVAMMVEITEATTMDLIKGQMLINPEVVRVAKIEEWIEADEVVVNTVATKEAQVIVPTTYLEENHNHRIESTSDHYVFY